MSDVLNNEQINLLLKEIDRMEKSEKKDKSVKVYDFFIPNKFSKERLKALANIFENFSRALSMYLSGAFRVGCAVKVGDIREKRFGEFISEFEERELMGVIDINVNNVSLPKEKVTIKLPNKFCLFAYVKLLGDSGDRVYTDNSFVGRSDIECVVLEHFLQNFVPYLNSAWKSVYPVQFELNALDNHPKISQAMSENSNVVDIQLDLMLSKMKQTLNICLPSAFLDDVFEYIDKNTIEPDERSTENNGDQIMSSIAESKLEIRTVLDNIELTLGDVYNLQPGDIIQLDKPRDEAVQMYIGDTVWFTGTLGTSSNHVAVKISDVIKHFNG
jgi:flagellar motor switch protein FliM